MVINMSELFTVDGTVKTYEVPLEMSEVIWKRKKHPIVSKQPVELRLTHEGDRKIAITAKVSLVLEMPCDRCLDSVKVPMDLDFERNVDANASSEERIAQLDEQSYIDGYHLDVDGMVLDEMMTDIPDKVLCREDCKGVCPKCGVNLNHQTCNCDRTELDPRMSIIREIFAKNNRTDS